MGSIDCEQAALPSDSPYATLQPWRTAGHRSAHGRSGRLLVYKPSEPRFGGRRSISGASDALGLHAQRVHELAEALDGQIWLHPGRSPRVASPIESHALHAGVFGPQNIERRAGDVGD